MLDAQSAILERIGSRLPLGENIWTYPVGAGQWPQASVLVALTAEAEPSVLLGRRAMHLPLHPGEIAFAGGKREAMDLSPWQTATREALDQATTGFWQEDGSGYVWVRAGEQTGASDVIVTAAVAPGR